MASPRSRHLIFLFWIAPAIVATYGMHVVTVLYNQELNILEKFGAQYLMWMSWGVWSVVIFGLLDRVPFSKGRIARPLALLFPLSALVVFVQILVMAGVTRLYGLGPARHFDSTIAIGVRAYGDVFVVTFWAIVGAHAAFRWYEEWRAQTAVATQLRQDLAAAQLRALEAQLNPHFLFNALNSIVTLIGRKPGDAQRMVVRLAELLRTTLAISSEQEVSVKRELELVEHYLEIERIRFQDRLTVTWDIDDDAKLACVPALSLQPLVENAILHGTSPLPGAGRIAISAHVRGSAVVLTVRDNGVGPSAPRIRRGSGAGIGISNLRERLERLYGPSGSLELADAPGGGALATLTLPFRAIEASRLAG